MSGRMKNITVSAKGGFKKVNFILLKTSYQQFVTS
jgi:hypothetical protein